MKTLSRWILALSLVIAFPVTSFAAASTVSEILNVPGNREVTRAEFLKAGIVVLGLDVDFSAPPRQYRIYPEEIRAYVRVAGEAKALDAFGETPDLSQTVTRGEAVRFLAELKTWQGTGAVLPFSDVPAGTDLEAAVRLAVQRSWLKPFRERTFGVNAALRGKEALSLLTRAATDAGRAKVQTIKIQVKRNDPVGFASKKFRDQIQNLLKDEYLYADQLKSATGTTAAQFVDAIKDPYTTLFDPTEATAFRQQLSGTVTGIGVHLDEEHFDVLSVIAGSPAERSGMKAGDRIVSINKKRVEGMKFDDVINRIRGREGSPVRIGVVRDGDDLSFDIVRAVIDIPDTKVEVRDQIAIVKISQFGDHVIKDGAAMFKDLAEDSPTGIILDLRSNPGGYLQAVPPVLNALLPHNTTYLYTRGRTFKDSFVTDGDPVIPADVPLVVLVNENTASAAEIVAGALQDTGRGTIVGKKTFGKGTVQTVYPFSNKASLKFTVAEWLTPNEHPINKIGITPDIDIDQSDAGDVQLEKALEIIRANR